MNEVCIWVTRPSPAELCTAIEAAGFSAIAVPTLEIAAPDHPDDNPDALAGRAKTELESAQMAVFVSRNAVDWLWRLLGDAAKACLASTAVIAVGPGTAAALRERGNVQVLLPNSGADSEALLGMPQLVATAIAGKRIVIIRGQGGRELLGETLTERGANVQYLEVYVRRRRDDTAVRLPQLWRECAPAAIVVTSPAGLDALLAMTEKDDRSRLRETRLVCLGRRLPEQARTRGFRYCIPVAAEDGDAAIVKALQAEFIGERDQRDQ